MIDLEMIDKGKPYKSLNQSYIIFICTFDLFGKGRHIYSFQNICQEDNRIYLGDGTAKIFLNTDSNMDDVSKELRAFLDYVAGKESEDSFVKKLNNAVREAKKNREWRHEYMTLLMRDQENIEKGIEQGIVQGIEQGIEKGIIIMVENALLTTGDIEQTAKLLKIAEEKVRKIANERGINVKDKPGIEA